MTGTASPTIRTFRPGDLTQVRDLFASGLMEFAGDVSDQVQRYVDHSLRDDMADIPGHYLSGLRSNFWVADSAGEVVGIVGIQPRERPDEAELRRMSVSPTVRRQGLGQRLLETTEEFCRGNGYRRICLSSVNILQPALAMYQKYGYRLVKEEPYGEPPHQVIVVHHMIKELG
ncbi:MAG: hypothetical protein CL732_04575 [Chloroflexi bacterium]|nr:hypothetical protein [Chloroflexota bacterium]